MKIVYTKHAAIDKFTMLKKHKFKITKRAIRQTIENPDNEDKNQYPPKIIASKEINRKHVLRVVYRRENDKIIVITFYSAQKGRYY